MIRYSLLIGLLGPLLATSLAWGDTPVDSTKTAKPTAKMPASKPDAGEAHRILQRADEATKKVTTVKYSLRAQRVGVPDETAGKLSGTVIMSGWRRGRPAKFRMEVETHPGGGSETATVIVGFDGEQYWALDMRDKRTFAGEDIRSIGVYQVLIEFFPIKEFVLPEPFADELRARQQKLLGTEDVNGEPCYKIHTVYVNPGQEATWYFSKKDYLPRRVDRVVVDPDDAKLARSSVISSIVVDPDLADDVFSLSIPPEFIVEDGSTP